MHFYQKIEGEKEFAFPLKGDILIIIRKKQGEERE